MSSTLCKNCGHETSENDTFCEMCGSLLHDKPQHLSRRVSFDDVEVSLPKWGTVDLYRHAKVVLIVEADEPTEFEITFADKTEWIFGRCYDEDPCPDIDLGEEGKQLGVSRRHFAVKLHETYIVIVDLHSTNRTYLNAQALIPDHPRALRNGDVIRVGHLRMKVEFRS